MKRYALFGGRLTYPSGGWFDLQGDFDSIEEARIAGRKYAIAEYRSSWWHIVDMQEGSICFRDYQDDVSS